MNKQTNLLMEKLTTPLDAGGNAETAKRFLKGGYGQDGFGVADGAALNGSFALTGNQGYFTTDPTAGKKAFFNTVSQMKSFFKRRASRLKKQIK